MKKRSKKSVSFSQRLAQSNQAKHQNAILNEQQKLLNDWKEKDVLYEFDMSFVIEQTNKEIGDYAELNGIDLEKGGFVPEFVVIKAYQEQDLIIALKMQNLATPKYWEVGIDSHFYKKSTDEILTIPFSIELPEMSHADLMNGCKSSVMRKGGIKTRWKGLQKEMIDNWEDHGIPEGFNLIQSQIYIKAQAHFRSFDSYKEHHYLLAKRDEGVLTEFLELKRRVHTVVAERVSEAA